MALATAPSCASAALTSPAGSLALRHVRTAAVHPASLPPSSQGGPPAVPELAQLVAAQDSAAQGSPTAAAAGCLAGGAADMLWAASLPPALQGFIVDPSAFEYSRLPNGQLHVLGEGARRAAPLLGGWRAALRAASACAWSEAAAASAVLTEPRPALPPLLCPALLPSALQRPRAEGALSRRNCGSKGD